MGFLKTIRAKLASRKRGVSFLVFAAALFSLPQVSNAQLGFILDLGYKVISQAALGISYILSYLAGVVIAIESWLFGLILNLNTTIINSPPVLIGFPITLAVANLAFVLALIVMAVMTILRNETYGAKKALSRLIIMAVLVNFGLVICGAALAVSDQVTKYFVKAIVPPSADSTGFASLSMNFSSSIVGAFNPQRGFFVQERDAGAVNNAFQAWGNDFGQLLIPLSGLVFNFFSLLLIILTLAGLIGAFLYRYVVLGYLLIILPLAWASWVFPKMGGFDKWWKKFLSQLLVGPVTLFYLWLAILTSDAISNNSAGFQTFIPPGDNPLSAFAGGLIGNFAPSFLQMIIVLSLMWMGLITGKQYADGGVDGALHIANDMRDRTVKFAKGYASKARLAGQRAAGRAASAPARIKFGADNKSLADRSVGWSREGGILGRFGARQVDKLASMGEGQVKQYESEVSKMGVREKKIALSGASGPKLMALVNSLQKDSKLDPQDVNHLITKEQRAAWESYGQKNAFKDLEKAALKNAEMAELIAKGASEDAILAESVKFFSDWSDKDAGKAMIDQIAGDASKNPQSQQLLEASLYGAGMKSPGLVSKLMSKANAGNREVIQKTYARQLEKMKGKISEEEYNKRKKAFDSALSNLMSGGGHDDDHGHGNGGHGDKTGGGDTAHNGGDKDKAH